MKRCWPDWRCLRYGCQRCDRDRQRDTHAEEILRAIDRAAQAREETRQRRENDPTVN
jgi:hypothetical protein